jgi:hypothetical protein
MIPNDVYCDQNVAASCISCGKNFPFLAIHEKCSARSHIAPFIAICINILIDKKTLRLTLVN